VNDPDVVKAFNDYYQAHKTGQKDPVATLLSMAEMNGWSPDDIELLKAVPVDNYYKIFKTHRGDQLRKIINVYLQFDRFGNASVDMREISRRAKEALKRIGQESDNQRSAC
jgi:hypothetical protein